MRYRRQNKLGRPAKSLGRSLELRNRKASCRFSVFLGQAVDDALQIRQSPAEQLFGVGYIEPKAFRAQRTRYRADAAGSTMRGGQPQSICQCVHKLPLAVYPGAGDIENTTRACLQQVE